VSSLGLGRVLGSGLDNSRSDATRSDADFRPMVHRIRDWRRSDCFRNCGDRLRFGDSRPPQPSRFRRGGVARSQTKGETPMEKMLVAVFDNDSKAYEGSRALAQLDGDGSI